MIQGLLDEWATLGQGAGFVQECLQNRRLLWFGHLERMEESPWPSKTRNFRVGGSLARERPRKTWCGVIRIDLVE